MLYKFVKLGFIHVRTTRPLDSPHPTLSASTWVDIPLISPIQNSLDKFKATDTIIVCIPLRRSLCTYSYHKIGLWYTFIILLRQWGLRNNLLVGPGNGSKYRDVFEEISTSTTTHGKLPDISNTKRLSRFVSTPNHWSCSWPSPSRYIIISGETKPISGHVWSRPRF